MNCCCVQVALGIRAAPVGRVTEVTLVGRVLEETLAVQDLEEILLHCLEVCFADNGRHAPTDHQLCQYHTLTYTFLRFVSIINNHFYPHDAMLAQVLTIGLCLCVLSHLGVPVTIRYLDTQQS